jgi:hypothetical protein
MNGMAQFYAWTVLVVGSTLSSPSDADCDGVTDAIETAVLQALAPAWYPELVRRPQPIDWMVRHGFAKVFRRSDGAYVGRVPAQNVALTPDQFLTQFTQAQTVWPTGDFEYRWAYFNAAQGRETNDPNDPFDWPLAAAQGRGLYGRVTPSPSGEGLLLVQYFLHFGWNETDAPPGCSTGNHEGDWIALDFDVDCTDPNRPRIVRGWFHNHGRQIVIESPDAFAFDGQRARVYLERGVQEPWPFSSSFGFGPGQAELHPCVSTNRLLINDVASVPCSFEYESGCNAGYTAVREHEGLDGAFVIEPLNVGEVGAPADNAEARFFMAYSGLYGSEWHGDGCWIPGIGVDTTSPPGPAHGSNGQKMWRREGWDPGLQWMSWAHQPVVYASPSGHPRPDGSQQQPFRTLNGALGVVANGGEIRLNGGTYSDGPMTIRNPVTIRAIGGAATIAP